RVRVELCQSAEPPVVVNVMRDHALARFTLGPFGHRLEPLRSNDLLRLLEISFPFIERLLAIEHARACKLAQSLNVLAGKCHWPGPGTIRPRPDSRFRGGRAGRGPCPAAGG